MILTTFSANTSPSDPPNAVKSWLNTATRRPSIVPWPVTTPSPRMRLSSSPNPVARWTANASVSTNEPSSSSRSTRSRAVSLPRSCCLAMAASPPPAACLGPPAIAARRACPSWSRPRGLLQRVGSVGAGTRHAAAAACLGPRSASQPRPGLPRPGRRAVPSPDLAQHDRVAALLGGPLGWHTVRHEAAVTSTNDVRARPRPCGDAARVWWSSPTTRRPGAAGRAGPGSTTATTAWRGRCTRVRRAARPRRRGDARPAGGRAGDGRRAPTGRCWRPC